jgi:putative methyltransferase
MLAENDKEDGDEDRLKKLASFQLKMIKHAMQCEPASLILCLTSNCDLLVPNVQRIVYSTCSVHAIENEQVVSSALGSDEAVAAGFVLAPREDVLPTWRRRGHQEKMERGMFFW